jgi:hypothetical protein
MIDGRLGGVPPHDRRSPGVAASSARRPTRDPRTGASQSCVRRSQRGAASEAAGGRRRRRRRTRSISDLHRDSSSQSRRDDFAPPRFSAASSSSAMLSWCNRRTRRRAHGPASGSPAPVTFYRPTPMDFLPAPRLMSWNAINPPLDQRPYSRNPSGRPRRWSEDGAKRWVDCEEILLQGRARASPRRPYHPALS